jgi:hypothetical protein
MKTSFSVLALAVFMTSAASMLVSQTAFAEDQEPTIADDSGMGGPDSEVVNDDFEGLNPYDPIVNEDGTISCRDCEVNVSDEGVDPEIYQTSGGPEVQRTMDEAPSTRPSVSFNSSSDDGDTFHEIMRKKRRAARSN